MDLAFHYFAVKTLARKAGFSEADAQQIAIFSQYIDDYNAYYRRYYSNIPQIVKDSAKYDLYRGDYIVGNYSPMTTGFWSGDDLALEALHSYQRDTIAPFHFPPIDADTRAAGNNRTSPAEYGDGSYASNHLADAIGRYRAAANETDRSRGLMYIGMALHTFADTYAHQLFSGLSEWANNMDIISVRNNITGEDETQLYKDRQIKFIYWLKKLVPSITPMIGHMHIAHVPDYTHISFSMSYPIDPQSHTADGVYTRSNTNEFVKASQKIYRILENVKGTAPISDADWNTFADRLTTAFKFDISPNVEDVISEAKTIQDLIGNWHGVFSEYQYAYDRHSIFDGAIGPYGKITTAADVEAETTALQANGINDMPEDFYYYSMFAEDMLVTLYGNKPRMSNDSAVNEAEETARAVTV
jgi:hypothetical protein